MSIKKAPEGPKSSARVEDQGAYIPKMAAKKKTEVKPDVVEISLETLLESGAHFGHQYRRWNPKMADFMYSVKDGVYVFDLIKTKAALEEALQVLTKAAKENQVILFVGTKKQAKDKVKEIAEAVDSPYIIERWLGGTLTNFGQIKDTNNQIANLREKLKTAKEEGYTKKERLIIARKLEKLERMFGGITSLKKHPDLIVIIDTHREHVAIKEAKKVGIPTVGVVDSNANPDLVDYPVPMNDDASKTLDYVLDLFKAAVLLGKGKKQKVKNAKN